MLYTIHGNTDYAEDLEECVTVLTFFLILHFCQIHVVTCWCYYIHVHYEAKTCTRIIFAITLSNLIIFS